MGPKATKKQDLIAVPAPHPAKMEFVIEKLLSLSCQLQVNGPSPQSYTLLPYPYVYPLMP